MCKTTATCSTRKNCFRPLSRIYSSSSFLDCRNVKIVGISDKCHETNISTEKASSYDSKLSEWLTGNFDVHVSIQKKIFCLLIKIKSRVITFINLCYLFSTFYSIISEVIFVNRESEIKPERFILLWLKLVLLLWVYFELSWITNLW